MGLSDPWISFTAQAAPAASSGFWTFVGSILSIALVQGVTLFIFYTKLSDDRSKEDRERDAAWDRFRQTNLAEADRDRKNHRMNMKRDVYMEMAPAIQQNAAHLTEFLRIGEPMEKIQKGIRIRQRQIQQSISKLLPVASDDTLARPRATGADTRTANP